MFRWESWHSGEYNVNAALHNFFKNYLGFLKDCVVFTKIYVRGVDHDHHPLQEEKLVAGAGAEGCVEGLVWEGRDLAYFDLLLHKLLANMAETIVSHES